MNSFKNYFKYTFDFVGVASRKEFWPVFLCVLAVYILAFVFLFLSIVFQVISLIVSLLLLLPTLSLIVRRLHDTDRGAKTLLWWLVPFAGMVIVLIFLTEKTKYVISSKN